MHTAKATLDAITNHVDWRNELLENSRGVADNLLCGECMGSYVATVLTSLRQRLPLLDSALNQRTLHTANATLAELLHRENCARHFAAGLVEVVRGTPRNRREPGWSITWRTAATGAAACDVGSAGGPFRDPKMSAAGSGSACPSGSAWPGFASVGILGKVLLSFHATNSQAAHDVAPEALLEVRVEDARPEQTRRRGLVLLGQCFEKDEGTASPPGGREVARDWHQRRAAIHVNGLHVRAPPIDPRR